MLFRVKHFIKSETREKTLINFKSCYPTKKALDDTLFALDYTIFELDNTLFALNNTLFALDHTFVALDNTFKVSDDTFLCWINPKQKRVIQREYMLSNANTIYPPQIRVIQRE